MKKTFILALVLALSVSAGCNAEEKSNTDTQSNISGKKTRSVTCYSGNAVTYQHDNVILVASITDTDISARIQEADTGINMRVPVSQCYFKDN